MITLLEHRTSLTTERRASKDWSREAQVPSIVRDGVPYDPHLDRFFADLPLNGVRSQNSLRSYAYDLLVWVRFLDEARAKTVWQATREDVDAYHRARRHNEAPSAFRPPLGTAPLPRSTSSTDGRSKKGSSGRARSLIAASGAGFRPAAAALSR